PFAAGTDDHELQAVPPVDRVRRRDDAVERVIHLETERIRGVAEAPALADARCDELRRLAETLRPDARSLRERTDRCRNARRPPAADDVLEAVVPQAEDLVARGAALLLLARHRLHEVEHAVDVVVVDVA